jgi:hypothetical protein
MKVKPAACEPFCLSGLVTTTFTGPPACDGVVATIVVLVATTTVVAAGIPPKLTVAPGTKFAPVIVTVVPPFTAPELGATLVTVGAGLGRGLASCTAASTRLRISFLDRVSLPPLVDSELWATVSIDELRFPLTVNAGAEGGGGS